MTYPHAIYYATNWMVIHSLWIERNHGEDNPYYLLHPYVSGETVLERLGMIGNVPYSRWRRKAIMDDFGNLRLVDLHFGDRQWEYPEEITDWPQLERTMESD